MCVKSGDGDERCWNCSTTDADLRPVCLEGRDGPELLCPECYRELSEILDLERDAEVFGYAD